MTVRTQIVSWDPLATVLFSSLTSRYIHSMARFYVVKLFMLIVVSCEIILRVDGQTSGGASCEELHVYDSNTCNDWCGGGAALMPTSIFFNGNTCTCQNCPLRSKGQECPKDGQTTCFNPPGELWTRLSFEGTAWIRISTHDWFSIEFCLNTEHMDVKPIVKSYFADFDIRLLSAVSGAYFVHEIKLKTTYPGREFLS